MCDVSPQIIENALAFCPPKNSVELPLHAAFLTRSLQLPPRRCESVPRPSRPRLCHWLSSHRWPVCFSLIWYVRSYTVEQRFVEHPQQVNGAVVARMLPCLVCLVTLFCDSQPLPEPLSEPSQGAHATELVNSHECTRAVGEITGLDTKNYAAAYYEVSLRKISCYGARTTF